MRVSHCTSCWGDPFVGAGSQADTIGGSPVACDFPPSHKLYAALPWAAIIQGKPVIVASVDPAAPDLRLVYRSGCSNR